MNVIIDGVVYVPAGTFSEQSGELPKAVIRALVSGYYHNTKCHVDGNEPKAKCDCSGCKLYRVAIQVLGGEPKCKKEPLLEQLWESV